MVAHCGSSKKCLHGHCREEMEQHIRMYFNISLFIFLIKFNLLQVFLWIPKSLTHHEERTSRETYTWWSLHFMNCENHPQQKQRILQDTGRVFECTQSGALLSLRHQLTYLKQQLPYTCQRWLTTIAIGSSIDPLHHSNWLAASTWNVQPANVKVEKPKLETNAMSSRLCVLLLVDASLRSAGIREEETIECPQTNPKLEAIMAQCFGSLHEWTDTVYRCRLLKCYTFWQRFFVQCVCVVLYHNIQLNDGEIHHSYETNFLVSWCTYWQLNLAFAETWLILWKGLRTVRLTHALVSMKNDLRCTRRNFN